MGWQQTLQIKLWFNLLYSKKLAAYKGFQMAMSFIICTEF